MQQPACLHVPMLKERRPVTLSWERPEDVDGYELGCVFDETFETAAIGRTWDYVDNTGLSWEEIGAGAPSWDDLAALPAVGLSWDNMAVENYCWEELESFSHSWTGFHLLPARFTIYRGPGVRVRTPEEGYTWDNLGGMALDWNQSEAEGFSWEELDHRLSIGLSWDNLEHDGQSWDSLAGTYTSWWDFESQEAIGMDWDSLDSRWQSWQSLEEMDWDTFRRQRDSRPHQGHTVDIPAGQKIAQFRIRGYNANGPSAYLETSQLPIQPLFNRDGRLTLAAVKGRACLAQLTAREVEDFEGIVLKVAYDASVLVLSEKTLELLYADSRPSAWPVLVRNSPGSLEFTCTRPIPSGTRFSGLVLLLDFVARKTAVSTIVLS